MHRDFETSGLCWPSLQALHNLVVAFHPILSHLIWIPTAQVQTHPKSRSARPVRLDSAEFRRPSPWRTVKSLVCIEPASRRSDFRGVRSDSKGNPWNIFTDTWDISAIWDILFCWVDTQWQWVSQAKKTKYTCCRYQVPPGGELHFHLLKGGDAKQVVGQSLSWAHWWDHRTCFVFNLIHDGSRSWWVMIHDCFRFPGHDSWWIKSHQGAHPCSPKGSQTCFWSRIGPRNQMKPSAFPWLRLGRRGGNSTPTCPVSGDSGARSLRSWDGWLHPEGQERHGSPLESIWAVLGLFGIFGKL